MESCITVRTWKFWQRQFHYFDAESSWQSLFSMQRFYLHVDLIFLYIEMSIISGSYREINHDHRVLKACFVRPRSKLTWLLHEHQNGRVFAHFTELPGNEILSITANSKFERGFRKSTKVIIESFVAIDVLWTSQRRDGLNKI